MRDPLANPGAISAARQRSMAERLELAISWNKLASELRAGMMRSTQRAAPRELADTDPDAGRAAPETTPLPAREVRATFHIEMSSSECTPRSPA